jgi:hypothetical protein
MTTVASLLSYSGEQKLKAKKSLGSFPGVSPGMPMDLFRKLVSNSYNGRRNRTIAQ